MYIKVVDETVFLLTFLRFAFYRKSVPVVQGEHVANTLQDCCGTAGVLKLLLA